MTMSFTLSLLNSVTKPSVSIITFSPSLLRVPERDVMCTLTRRRCTYGIQSLSTTVTK